MRKIAIVALALLLLLTSCDMMHPQLEQREWWGHREAETISSALKTELETYNLQKDGEPAKDYALSVYLYRGGRCIVRHCGLLVVEGTWSADGSTITITGDGNDGNPFLFSSSYDLGGGKLDLGTPILGISHLESNGVLL